MKPSTLPYQEGSTAKTGNRANEMRRDNDVVKVPKISLYDIDYAIYFHISEMIKPRVMENGSTIPVPVMFANGEKWAQIRSNGYLRDNTKKVLSPIIMIRRTSIANDERLPIVDTNLFNPGTFSPKTKIIPYKTTNMIYDRTAGQYVSKDSYEFYVTDVPDYVRITYELIIWTDLMEQMNPIVASIIGMSDHVWGDYRKFRTNVQDISHENVNIPGEDRLVKTTITLLVDGYLRTEYEYHQSKIQKAFSIKRVKFLSEGSEEVLFNQIEDINAPTTETNNIADATNVYDGSLKRKIRL